MYLYYINMKSICDRWHYCISPCCIRVISWFDSCKGMNKPYHTMKTDKNSIQIVPDNGGIISNFPLISLKLRCWCPVVSDSVTRLESRFLMTRTRIELRWENSTRVTVFTEWLDSKFEPELFLQNLWASNRQSQLVCTQIHEHFLLQWSSTLAQIFCFCYLVVLYCILSI